MVPEEMRLMMKMMLNGMVSEEMVSSKSLMRPPAPHKGSCSTAIWLEREGRR